MTTHSSPAPRPALPSHPLLLAHAGTDLTLVMLDAGRVQVVASADDGCPGLRIESDLADAVGYWTPGHRGARPLPADWTEPSTTSLVESAPMGVLHNAAGVVILGWAADEFVSELSIRAGVSEEGKSFTIDIRPLRRLDGPLTVVVGFVGAALESCIAELARWMAGAKGVAPRPALAAATTPVYSTWYTFSQDIDSGRLLSEAELAADLGAGAIFIDDGWQVHARGRGYQGCGDWTADPDKFRDLAADIRALRARGCAVALWVAPLLLGQESAAFAAVAEFAPSFSSSLNCRVLDPRYREARDFVVETCVRLVEQYGVDLLKIDFLDQAMAYAGTVSNGDVADVGRAMDLMLAEVRTGIAQSRPDVAFEFRQPYVSPALAGHGEIIRANDCPADSAANRVATIDARLFSVGQIVHSDPMMWGRNGGPPAVAQQLYAGWFSVPQISMRLATLPHDQLEALRGLLALWSDHAVVTQHGLPCVTGAERGYDSVSAIRADLGRQIIVRYADVVLDVGSAPIPRLEVVNATPSESVVLRLRRPLLGGRVRSSSGLVFDTVGPAPAGLLELAVPAFGSLDLELESGRSH